MEGISLDLCTITQLIESTKQDDQVGAEDPMRV